MNFATLPVRIGLAAVFGIMASTAEARRHHHVAPPAPPPVSKAEIEARDEARMRIGILNDQLQLFTRTYADRIAAAEAEPVDAANDPQTCYSLDLSDRFSFDYGPGSIAAPVARLVHTYKAAAGKPPAVPADKIFYPDIESFITANDRKLTSSAGYASIDIPSAVIGCADTPIALKAIQTRLNQVFFQTLNARFSNRIEADYFAAYKILYPAFKLPLSLDTAAPPQPAL